MRRLIQHSNKNKRLRELESIISENDKEDTQEIVSEEPVQDLEDDNELEDAELSRIDDEIKSAENLGDPIVIDKEQLKNLNFSSKLTKNIALNNKSKHKSFNSNQPIVNEKPNRLSLVTQRRKPQIVEDEEDQDSADGEPVSAVEQIVSDVEIISDNVEEVPNKVPNEISSSDEVENVPGKESSDVSEEESESQSDENGEGAVEIQDTLEEVSANSIKGIEEEVDADDEIEVNDPEDDEVKAHTFTKTVLTPSRLKRTTKSPMKTPAKSPKSPLKTVTKSPSKTVTKSPLKAVTKSPTKSPRQKQTTPVEPTRKSTRHRIPPVASWKNEKVVYKTEKVNGVYVKTVTNVAQAIEEPVPRSSIIKKPTKASSSSKAVKSSKTVKPTTTTTQKKRKQQLQPSSVNKKAKKRVEIDPYEYETPVDEPGSDWQKQSSISIPVFEGPGAGTQVERVVAWAPNSYKNSTVISNDQENFRINTLFDIDSEFCGAGIIEISSGDKKAVKSNNDTYFIFHVINGSLNVSINNTTFTVTNGCTFEIPMGNYYQFINTGNDTAKLLFVQAKYVVIGESDDDDDDDSEDSEEEAEE